MRRHRSSASIMASPVLVGAVTTLVVVVAVFLAYNANSGLPFVPTTDLRVEIANGANLTPGNDVREGGYRVGTVSELEPVRVRDGRTVARITVKLDRKVGDIPSDTRFVVRPRSALGLKYVELQRGRSRELFRNGDVVPVAQSRVPVELDEVYNTFDEPTRRASATNLDGFGDALAGRGGDVNAAIGELPDLLTHLEPVARTLAEPDTQLPRFFQELGDTARVLAPVAPQQAELFTRMADTFEAFSREPENLKATIAKSPTTLRVGTRSLRAQRPFLTDTALASVDLRAATGELRAALPDLDAALRTGTPVVRRSAQLNTRLQTTLDALGDLSRAPGTGLALRQLTSTVTTLNPTLRYLGPFVTVCNSWNSLWTFVAEHLSEPDATGESQRALFNFTNPGSNTLGSQGASRPANTDQSLHGQVYGAAIDEQGNADCENGQRGYLDSLNAVGDPKYHVAIDPHTPGAQGPHYLHPAERGGPLTRSRVPRGQTFSRAPETGPQPDPRFPR